MLSFYLCMHQSRYYKGTKAPPVSLAMVKKLVDLGQTDQSNLLLLALNSEECDELVLYLLKTFEMGINHLQEDSEWPLYEACRLRKFGLAR